MSETRVIHVKEMPEFLDSVYIGRAVHRVSLKESYWANVFQMHDFTRAEVIDMYEHFITVTRPFMLAKLPELRGHELACWCRWSHQEKTTERACHGDILVSLLERYTDDELIAMAQAS